MAVLFSIRSKCNIRCRPNERTQIWLWYNPNRRDRCALNHHIFLPPTHPLKPLIEARFLPREKRNGSQLGELSAGQVTDGPLLEGGGDWGSTNLQDNGTITNRASSVVLF
jgi:hypothetical protein